jgi:hypothetical protein
MGCLTLGFYVNSGAKGKGHEGRNGPLRNESGRAGDAIGAKEKPQGDSLGLVVGT